MDRSRGFTLIELMLSLVIIGILVGLSLPIYQSFSNRNDMDIAAEQTAEALRRAQTYARGMKNDSAWSVEIQSAQAILFRGTNFAGRDTAYDESITFSGGTTASGLAEVQFAKLTAQPNTTGTITLTNENNETRTVTVNEHGMVDY